MKTVIIIVYVKKRDAVIVVRMMKDSMAQLPDPRPTPPAGPGSYLPLQRITTADLMQGARAIIVLHQGEEYLLRITNKLILTR